MSALGQKQTFAAHWRMSAKCQKRTFGGNRGSIWCWTLNFNVAAGEADSERANWGGLHSL